MFNPSTPDRRGTTTVEFAMVAPVLFLLVLGIFEFGRGFMVQHLLTAAARQGCRIAILPGKSTATVQSTVNSTLSAEGISGATMTLLVNGASAAASGAQSNDQITVTISVPVKNIACGPASGYLSGTLTGQASLRRE